MITAILILLAALFNAVMDRVGDTVAFNNSIFHKKDPAFWCKDVSWRYAKKVFGWKADAWHIAKSSMIICLVAGAVLYNPAFNVWIDFFAFGALWNASFNIGYNTLFKK